MFQGMAKRLSRIQCDLATLQQRDHAVNAGKRGEFAIAGNGRNTGAPGKITRCGRKTANLTCFASTITPETDRHFTDIKILHHHS